MNFLSEYCNIYNFIRISPEFTIGACYPVALTNLAKSSSAPSWGDISAKQHHWLSLTESLFTDEVWESYKVRRFDLESVY